MLKKLIKSIIPKSVLLSYHKILAIAANVYYGFPSRKLIVIGVTGTKGKSSTTLMIVRILEEAGFKVGSTNTIFFKVGDKEWPNNTKQGMPGRFKLQKYLRQMVDSGCTHAVIEVTSEGILQSRQWGIAFDEAVFTNLSPEHIESHGSYEKYREDKSLIFKNLNIAYRKTISKDIKKVIVVNRMEKEADYFLQFPADEKWGVWGDCAQTKEVNGEKKVCGTGISETDLGVKFTWNNQTVQLSLHGEFMAINALLAMAVGQSLDIEPTKCISALEKIKEIPGRVQVIKARPGFTVMIDYAHEPRSFEAILTTGRNLAKQSKLIVVFGATGGGRDQAKRPLMGGLAAKYADYIILTTDDPYNDDPAKLIADIVPGLRDNSDKWQEQENWWSIIDRGQAIKKALEIAKKGDIVLLLGKGSESVMAIGDKYIPWSDFKTVQDILK